MATFHMKSFRNIKKYRCDSLVSFFFYYFYLFIVNYDERIARESFSFKIILRSPWYNHPSSNVSVIFIYCGLLGDNFPLSTRFVNIADILTVTLVTGGVITWSVLHGGCNNVCRIKSKWRPEILNEIEYLGFHNYNVFIYFYLKVLSLHFVSKKKWI
jgi:hypothetical protein